MSTLVVQVRTVDQIEDHPNAQRLKIATVGGWKTCIRYNPETGETQFQVGEKCVFFPPDSVLPESLANSPTDNPPGRLGIKAYLKALPKEENGNRPAGWRVAAQRIRNVPSFGVIMKLDAAYGDDPNWEVGTDVKEHYGVQKYEPILTANDLDAEFPHVRFHSYTGIEHLSNFQSAFENLNDVIFTEKIHGKNCRMGLILDSDDNGQAQWKYMVGSHDTRRKEFFPAKRKFKLDDLISHNIDLDPEAVQEKLANNEKFYFTCWNNKHWLVEEIIQSSVDESSVWKLKCCQVTENHSIIWEKSIFWKAFSTNVSSLLDYLVDKFPFPEQKYSVILFGELYGVGIQDMQYGLNEVGFRAFDIAINRRYLDFDVKTQLFSQYGIIQAPVLYRGPFSQAKVEEYTSGATTLCSAKEAGAFKGREGIVITPTKEVDYCPIMNGRLIAKSVSADYLARQNGTEFH